MTERFRTESWAGSPCHVVALHGNLGSFQDWDCLNIAEIQAIDLWEQSHRTFTDFSAMLKGATKADSFLMGYSMGGRLALHAMAANPKHWAGAVIISAHPGLCCVQERIERRISDEIWAKHAREMAWDEFLEKWNNQAVLGDAPVSKKQNHLEAMREKITLGFENWSLGKQNDLRSSLARFKNPVLWITGELDEKFTHLGEEMKNVFPDFRHVVIPDCGHRVLQDAPEELAGELKRFIEV